MSTAATNFKDSRYFHRNRVLNELGFDSYTDYLRSDLWKSIRSRVLARFRGKCQSCGATATEVHHKHYSKSVLLGEHIIGLTAICRACHESSELDGEIKVDVTTANRRMRLIGEANGRVKPLCVVCKKNPTKGKATVCRRCTSVKSKL